MIRQARAWKLTSRELRRFLFAVWGDNGQWYWAEVKSQEGSINSLILHATGIHFDRDATLYGMEVYDDEGELVCCEEFNSPRHCSNGDVLNVSHAFSEVLWQPSSLQQQ